MRSAWLKGLGPRRRGREWRRIRATAERDYCDVCGCFLHARLADGTIRRKHPPVDHIVPAAFVLRYELDPHATVNLMTLCPSQHSFKTHAAEPWLFKGDLLRFLEVLRKAGWPMHRVANALHFYGLVGRQMVI